MGKTSSRDHLQLVSSFSDAAYPYYMNAALENPYDGAELYNKKQRLESAAQMAGVSDYKIFSSSFDVSLHLLNEDDFDMVSVAMRPDGEIEQRFAFAPEGYDFRKLKNRCNKLQNIVRKTSLVGQVYLDVDREEKSIVVIADNKHAYLGFRRLLSDTPVFTGP